MAFLRTMPILQVNDVRRSIAFYKRLGFSGMGWNIEGTDELQFVIAQRGDVTFGLQLLRGQLHQNTHWAAYIYVDNLEELHQQFTAEGLEPTEINRLDYYGCDDFDLRDPDGHLLAFGQARDTNFGPGLSDNRGMG